MSTTNSQPEQPHDTAETSTPAVSLKGKRYKARARALALLFEAESRDVDPIALAEERREYALQLAHNGEGGMPLVSDYAVQIVSGVAEEIDRVDEVLESYLTDWTVDRLAAVDRTVLRIGIWELLFGPDDVPGVTAVDEAVTLVREYSDDKAPSFVNGVLDRVLRDVDTLKETGEDTLEVDAP